MRLSKSSLLFLILTLGGAGVAKAYDDSQPAKGLVPWESSEIARLWSEAKADYAANNYDAAIAAANRYLSLVEPDASMQALLGEAYFRKQLNVLAVEHLNTAISIAKSQQKPVPARWMELLRQSGGEQDVAPQHTAAVPSAATPSAIRKTPPSSQAPISPPPPAQTAATQRALLIYDLEAQLAKEQAQALGQVRDAETAVARARAEATPPDLNAQVRAIQQQRQKVQNDALVQQQRAQADAERGRSQSEISRVTPSP
jgi:hypothetical protein